VPPTDDSLLKRLLATFKVEAREHIDAIAAGLIDMERASAEPVGSALLDIIFRAAHSLKGAARTVNARDIESLCQALESVFAALRRKEIQLAAESFDLLHQVVAMLVTLLQFDSAHTDARRPSIAELLRALHGVTSNRVNVAPSTIPTVTPASEKPAERLPEEVHMNPPRLDPSVSAAAAIEESTALAAMKRHSADTIRVATAKLDAVVLQAEELVAAKLAVAQQAQRLRQLRLDPVEWSKRWNKLRPDLRGVRRAIDGGSHTDPLWPRVMEFLDFSATCVGSLELGLTELVKSADHDQRSLGGMVDNLLDEMKKVVMQPFAGLLEVLPRTVREVAREQGKIVELTIHGDSIEIDRRILEEMKDPLIHLLRNCVDHGIESPEVRGNAGKSRQGSIAINVSMRDGGSVELLVRDDGAGIDAQNVREFAIKQNLISPQAAAELNDTQAVALIFQSGVSTSPIITDISGRGLGLAIVKEKVEKLTGSLTVETQPGSGTTFRIVLPVTLTRFRGVLVRVARRLMVIPTSSTERVSRVAKKDIKTVEGRETILFGGVVTSLARLADVLELPPPVDADIDIKHHPLVVLAHAGQRIAFVVDEVLTEQEVLVKPLGRQLVKVRNIAGATVIGSGQVVPIVNVPDLMESAVKTAARNSNSSGAASAKTADKQSVLVAEDSITSRTLIKSILETAGYRVETAVDGLDGLNKARSGKFDLVVSDVEMPRMDGFGLTTQLRADKKLSHIPVILVTALNSREDRERGVDAGANAYIVKSSFDQSGLLEVVRRLI
jgi:two-component system chemotaxis sensor kinase CheA